MGSKKKSRKENEDGVDQPSLLLATTENEQIETRKKKKKHAHGTNASGSEDGIADTTAEPEASGSRTKSKRRKSETETEDIATDTDSDGKTPEKEESKKDDGIIERKRKREPASDHHHDDGEETVESVDKFEDMTLDERVLKALHSQAFERPTPIQAAVIPAALRGRDVLVTAPTGSGKTIAYAIPVLEVLLRSKRKQEDSLIRAVILVPTRELSSQVTQVFKDLLKPIGNITVANLKSKHLQKDASSSLVADIVVGTPAAATQFAQSAQGVRKVFQSVEFVVVDEADLVLSYGFGAQTAEALDLIPSFAQAMLVSATLDEDVEALRKVVLRRPLTVRVSAEVDTEGDAAGNNEIKAAKASNASHYYVGLPNTKDKFLVTYVMLRLGVLVGKILIFVNEIDTAFRLKLFLDQFSIRSAVLNSELPANSRLHCIEQYNAGIFDILIVADEGGSGAEADENSGGSNPKKANSKKDKKAGRKVKRDSDYGAVRGVDFRNVTAVLNFDLPRDSTSYTHRAGRTARAGHSGTVLSLTSSDSEKQYIESAGQDIQVFIKPLLLQKQHIESFRYRVEDSLRAVTKNKIRDARLLEVKRELMNSEKLSQYFEENPQDKDALKHDRALAMRVNPHLAHVPNYLLPPSMRVQVWSHVPGMSKDPRKRKRKMNRLNQRKKQSKGAGTDPLKTFAL